MPERLLEELPNGNEADKSAIPIMSHADFDFEPTISINEELLANLSKRDKQMIAKLFIIGRKIDRSIDNQIRHNEAIRGLHKRVCRIERLWIILTSKWALVCGIVYLASSWWLPKLISLLDGKHP